MPIAGYYSNDGTSYWCSSNVPQCLSAVVILPNGVTGTQFTLPGDPNHVVEQNTQFTLVDCVFQLGTYQPESSTRDLTRKLLATVNLERAALLFTPSKDLSIPGMRADVLVSKNADLMNEEQVMRRKHFIRSNIGYV
jgi:hypothetical protein